MQTVQSAENLEPVSLVIMKSRLRWFSELNNDEGKGQIKIDRRDAPGINWYRSEGDDAVRLGR